MLPKPKILSRPRPAVLFSVFSPWLYPSSLGKNSKARTGYPWMLESWRRRYAGNSTGQV